MDATPAVSTLRQVAQHSALTSLPASGSWHKFSCAASTHPPMSMPALPLATMTPTSLSVHCWTPVHVAQQNCWITVLMPGSSHRKAMSSQPVMAWPLLAARALAPSSSSRHLPGIDCKGPVLDPAVVELSGGGTEVDDVGSGGIWVIGLGGGAGGVGGPVGDADGPVAGADAGGAGASGSEV